MNASLIVEMAWKSALIAGVALVLVTLLRSRAAADRAAVLRLAVTFLLLLPVVALALPALQIETPVSVGSIATDAAVTEASDVAAERRGTSVTALPSVSLAAGDAYAFPAAPAPAPASMPVDVEFLIGLAYLCGLLAIGFRLGTGISTLRRWTANARPVTSPLWLDAFARLGGNAGEVRLLVSPDAPAPMSWGWGKTAILIDEDTLERPADARAILAHEMAHVMRRDWISLVLARAAVALFWFNPLVWMLEREVSQQAEEAADSHALGQVEPASYAQTLVTCARGLVGARVPANSIAPGRGGLARRVKAVLNGKAVAAGSRRARFAMLCCAGIAAPVAALKLVPPAPPAPAAAPAPAPVAPRAPSAPHAAIAPHAPVAALAAQAATAPAAPQPPLPPTESDRAGDYVDEAAIERAVERAEREAERAEARAESAADRAAERADRIAERIAEHAVRDVERDVENAVRVAEHATRNAGRTAEIAQRAAAKGMAAGADGMMRGAEGMDRGAKQMDEAAENLRSREFREKQIADAARQGRTVTHQELIDAIPGLKEGARGLRRSADEMRKSADDMRRQGL